jgi:hypothetical protein
VRTEAHQEHTGKVCLRSVTTRASSSDHQQFAIQGEQGMSTSSSNAAGSNAAHDRKINYIEFTTTSVARSKEFYSKAFGWSFQDWGPDYASFSAPDAGIDGGFRSGSVEDAGRAGGPLVVLYAADLSAVEEAIQAAGGTIAVPTFSFPGGRRFHFNDGAGNQLAVWSE